MKNIILNSTDISNKIRRIAFEIIENNIDEKKIFMIGLLPNGKYISEEINKIIRLNTDINTEIIFFEMDKKELSFKKIHKDFNFKILKDQVVIFIDDVMNTGTTLIYAINQILPFKPKEIQIGVLIERNFNNFPVLPNYKGLQLSTSKNEHVKVEIGKSPKVIII